MNILRNTRKARGISQEELGVWVGMPQCRISRYERGAAGMSTPTAKVLAEALNVPLESFKPLIREVGRPRRG
jgi:transcriptional regulator with XRE-family HTH domain